MQIRGYNISYVNKILKRFREISLSNLGKKMKDAKNRESISKIFYLKFPVVIFIVESEYGNI